MQNTEGLSFLTRIFSGHACRFRRKKIVLTSTKTGLKSTKMSTKTGLKSTKMV